MPLPLLIPALTAGAQAGLGLYQTLKGNKLQKEAMAEYKANAYQIPESATRSVNLYGRLSQGSQMAGQDIMESGIESRTAQTVSGARKAASSPSQVLASTIAAYGQEQQQKNQLNLAASQDFQRRQQMYAGAVQSLSPYIVESWKYRSLYPSQAKFNAASAFSGAGQQNMGQAVQSGLSMFANQQYLKGLNPQGETTQTPSSIVGGVNTVYDNLPSMGMEPMQPIQSIQAQPLTARAAYWGGGLPDNSIMKRQGNY